MKGIYFDCRNKEAAIDPKANTSSVTTSGLRATNQDRFCVEASEVFDIPAILLAVADGMGGMQAGDKAAEIAIETVRRYAKEVFPQVPRSQQELRAAITAMFQEANREVWQSAQASEATGAMGTTLVAAIVSHGRYLVANAGDSRCYYINNFDVRQITEDHSHVQELVRKGSMTPEAARRSPYRNQLTNSLGELEEIRVDIFPVGECYGVIDEDCVLLLCSDGLHGELGDHDFFRQLHGTRDLQSACRNLMSLALQNGSTDNITAAAAEFGKLARKGPRQKKLPPAESLIPQRKRTDEEPLAGAGKAARLRRRVSLLVVIVLVLTLLGFGGLLVSRDKTFRAYFERFVGGKERKEMPATPTGGQKGREPEGLKEPEP